jgi:hypothetical protein
MLTFDLRVLIQRAVKLLHDCCLPVLYLLVLCTPPIPGMTEDSSDVGHQVHTSLRGHFPQEYQPETKRCRVERTVQGQE